MSEVVAIIDDDEAVLDSLRMMLTRYGFEVRLFKSAEDYFAAGDQEAPCCIVCDVRLPDMSGLDLQAELRTRRSTVPLILITGHGDISITLTCLDLQGGTQQTTATVNVLPSFQEI